MPYVFVADAAFSLKSFLMKPFNSRNLHGTERIFNYRLSRARRVVENVFGIMAARFRILRRAIELDPNKAIKIVAAICALHNFIMRDKITSQRYAPPGTFDTESDGNFIPGAWRAELNQFSPEEDDSPPGRNENTGQHVREEFMDYFVKEGELSWQYNYI